MIGGIGTYHKRKSVQKIQAQMPKRKISENSRNESQKNHRTQYKGIESPQIELKNYKRKNFKILYQLQNEESPNIKSLKEIAPTDRTRETKFMTQQSLESGSKRNIHNYSVNSYGNDTSILKQDSEVLKQREQITSRFSQNHHDPEQSLAFLINQAKSKDSNPFINTARLKQEFKVESQEKLPKYQKYQKGDKKELQITSHFQSNQMKSVKQNDQQNIRQTVKQSNQNDDQDNQNEQNEELEGENFDDYQFGGQKSSSATEQVQQKQNISKHSKKKHNKKLYPPPKVQSYNTNEIVLEKPQNWRQLNRYVPSTQEEQRMTLQHYIKQKKSIQSKRQQQQIMKMIQQYQLNKNAMRVSSNRKVQTNKFIQKIYKDKKLQDTKHSLSLPQLKKNIKPIHEIIIPQAAQLYADSSSNKIQDKFKVKNLIAKHFQDERRKQLNSQARHSFSFGKLGFGRKQSRLLTEDEVKQTQLQNIEKIQKKLRQKGIEFNSNSIRNGLLNMRDIPIYKITKSKQINGEQQFSKQSTLDLPQKQLPSNVFYKIFPL